MPVNSLLVFAVILFSIGITGVLVRRNIFVVLMSIELMLNAANLVFITFARTYGDATGHVIALLVITLAAAEVGVGLGIFVAVRRTHDTVNMDEINLLKH